tara:strand:- start:184 stop:549 length:366 start_codon:yes stop_codon:yes gene_type:complete
MILLATVMDISSVAHLPELKDLSFPLEPLKAVEIAEVLILGVGGKSLPFQHRHRRSVYVAGVEIGKFGEGGNFRILYGDMFNEGTGNVANQNPSSDILDIIDAPEAFIDYEVDSYIPLRRV